MSHYHLEIILPPSGRGVDAAISEILKPFSEADEKNRSAFWDFFVIGGRWAGEHIECTLDPQKKDAFFAELNHRGVTVSALTCGKNKLQPATQIPMVDALFREFFPDSPLRACPFFDHFNDQYTNSIGFPDIIRLDEMPKDLAASRVIIAAAPHGQMEAVYMVERSHWNGVTWVDARWDGKVQTAIEEFKQRLTNYRPEYVEQVTPRDDWHLVTVDYHS